MVLSLRWLWLLVLLGLQGCWAVGPDYTRPEEAPPEAWHSPMKDGLRATPATPDALAQWWRTLNDPMLTELMVEVVDGNLDLKTAGARVREARARRGISKAAYLPALDANGTYQKVYTTENDTLNEISEQIPGLDLEQDRDTELYTAGFDALWEIDLFGGVRRSVEAATADLEASQAEFNGVLVSLLAETALNYVEMRTLQQRIEVAQVNVKAQQETYELTTSRYKAGLIDEYAVKTAQSLLSGTRAQIPALSAVIDAAMNRLAVLCGQTPGSLHDRLAPKAPIPIPPATVAVGVPAETLRKRPDVWRAERLLAAQTARIGVAKSDLYPKLSLFGNLGYESQSTDHFFDNANLAYRYGPRLSWGIFRGGAVFQNIEVQSAREEQALHQYKATVLGALEEAEDALAAYVWEQMRREELIVAYDSAALAFKLARNQYQAGLVDFSSVLIAQQAMLNYQDQLAQSDGAVTTNLVRLYKALGGGWSVAANMDGTPGKPSAER
jgi:NodT family efflux transporter outer membrane factor (OMF) lipoprotein